MVGCGCQVTLFCCAPSRSGTVDKKEKSDYSYLSLIVKWWRGGQDVREMLCSSPFPPLRDAQISKPKSNLGTGAQSNLFIEKKQTGMSKGCIKNGADL